MTSSRVITFLSPPEPCEYLRDRTSQLQYELVSRITTAEYMSQLKAGWRRFGYTIFRPQCPSCRMCESLRVPVATFRPDRSQRRAWTANRHAVSLEVGAPSRSGAKEALRDAFQRYQHEDKGWPIETADYDEMFVENPFRTEEWCYYLGDRLIAVGYVDRLPEGLSAIYFYYDPAERHRSLGTFNVLALIAAARERHLPHVYLGYYVEGCRSLEYKARFRPNEVLSSSGAWVPFSASQS
jgi:leucyl-tRNA---protein transferase